MYNNLYVSNDESIAQEPIELNIQEDTVIITQNPLYPPQNLNLFYDFLELLDQGISSTIRIITYNIEGEPKIVNLYYTGEDIYMTVNTLYTGIYTDFKGIKVYRGHRIVEEETEGWTDYNLTNNTKHLIFRLQH